MKRLGALLVLAMIGACYDEPRPDCGFRCGPAQECPEGYACVSSDGRCHRIGSDPALVCGSVDAAVPDAIDAADAEIIDAPLDAPGDAFVPDAPPIDAPPIDAPPIDAP